MNKYKKNRKKGFTLVEMILSLAIICLLGGVIAGICAAISNSFVTTYNIDDSTDYAMLYARGFENSFLANTQGRGSNGDTYEWWVDSGSAVPYLKMKAKVAPTTPAPSTTPGPVSGTFNVFEPKMIGNKTTSSKWKIYMFYRFNATTATVDYKIFVKDNYAKTPYVYVYEDSFWVPQFEARAAYDSASNRSIKVSGNEMTEETFLQKYHFSADEYKTVKQFVENSENAGFGSTIKYTWG